LPDGEEGSAEKGVPLRQVQGVNTFFATRTKTSNKLPKAVLFSLRLVLYDGNEIPMPKAIIGLRSRGWN
jgi:hypothetical protein